MVEVTVMHFQNEVQKVKAVCCCPSVTLEAVWLSWPHSWWLLWRENNCAGTFRKPCCRKSCNCPALCLSTCNCWGQLFLLCLSARYYQVGASRITSGRSTMPTSTSIIRIFHIMTYWLLDTSTIRKFKEYALINKVCTDLDDVLLRPRSVTRSGRFTGMNLYLLPREKLLAKMNHENPTHRWHQHHRWRYWSNDQWHKSFGVCIFASPKLIDVFQKNCMFRRYVFLSTR